MTTNMVGWSNKLYKIISDVSFIFHKLLQTISLLQCLLCTWNELWKECHSTLLYKLLNLQFIEFAMTMTLAGTHLMLTLWAIDLGSIGFTVKETSKERSGVGLPSFLSWGKELGLPHWTCIFISLNQCTCLPETRRWTSGTSENLVCTGLMRPIPCLTWDRCMRYFLDLEPPALVNYGMGRLIQYPFLSSIRREWKTFLVRKKWDITSMSY